MRGGAGNQTSVGDAVIVSSMGIRAVDIGLRREIKE
jgi:hypothetical protein